MYIYVKLIFSIKFRSRSGTVPTFGIEPHLITRYRTGASLHRCLIDGRRHPPPSSITTSSATCIDAAHLTAVPPVAARWCGPGCDQIAFQHVVHIRDLDNIGCRGRPAKVIQRKTFSCLHWWRRRGRRRNLRN